MKPGDIKEVRLFLNMSQPEFAKELNITGRTLLNYEKDKTSPTIETIQRIKELAKKHGFNDNRMVNPIEGLKSELLELFKQKKNESNSMITDEVSSVYRLCINIIESDVKRIMQKY
ncbi:DNA-binding transcriptional regulator [Flagellimonas sp. CMM7]|uniref:helix-turn-helix domain-containing protein n=1 Tax=Flagellimonas sp. CMM7 TaxID=2654676 RepID=UPI0013D3F436|nr:helix-turn-helix transcriptional regulator [Flagellimonas sp. CMM7]UII80056.1 helix-turn-helix domain-containing protein [Flagellimonas sp. CMM7]